MKTSNLSLKSILLLFTALLYTASYAQNTKALNVLIPMSIADKRGGPISKSVGGIDAMVNITVNCGIQYLDGCSDEAAGTYKGEFNWYDSNNETGKFLFDMVKQPANIEQEKKRFFEQGSFELSKAKMEEVAGGQLYYITESTPCVNEMTGATGKTGYFTQAKFYAFSGNLIIKIDFTSKIKPETVKTTIAKLVEEAKKFDFAVYKTTVIQESE